MIANLQRKVPVISTFHRSDINNPKTRWISKIAIRLSRMNIFVSEKMRSIAGNPLHSMVIPCGVDINEFYPMDKIQCRKQLEMDMNKTYILFSKGFSNQVTNYPLAKQSVEILRTKGIDVELVELKGYTRKQVVQLMNACDCGLMTSFNEGSPQFVKEALACNCPIVSTDVGDVSEQIMNLANCYVASFDPKIVAEQIEKCIKNYENYNGEPQIIRVENLGAAVEKAHEIAEKGDVVTLSPACASFDAFKNFAERGNFFKEEVGKL
jgi:glycosyltransferase involved in cell wall biosynthesis